MQDKFSFKIEYIDLFGCTPLRGGDLDNTLLSTGYPPVFMEDGIPDIPNTRPVKLAELAAMARKELPKI